MPERHFTLIVNPHAGRGRALAHGQQLRDTLAASGRDVLLVETESIDHATQAATAAASAGRIAVGCGGDGLLRAVAGGLAAADGGTPGSGAGGRPVMGIMPAGRGNDFARTLSLPTQVDAVARQLTTAGSSPIDLIDVDGSVALGNVYVGFDSQTTEVANAMPVNLGEFTYTYAGARTALTLPALTFTLTIDRGTPRHFQGQGVVVASSAYYGGAIEVAPGADPRNGVLDVICFRQSTRRARAAALIALLRGRHEQRDDVDHLQARREVRIELDPPMMAGADGDAIASTPLTARLMPQAIALIGA